MHWFLFLEDTQEKIEYWRQEYNHFHPHSSFNNLTLAEFAEAIKKSGYLI